MISPSPTEIIELEAYARALQDVLRAVTGSDNCAKSYDPLTVNLEDQRIDSYAFDLKRGGRHHPFDDFESLDEVKALMVRDVAQYLAPKGEI